MALKTSFSYPLVVFGYLWSLRLAFEFMRGFIIKSFPHVLMGSSWELPESQTKQKYKLLHGALLAISTIQFLLDQKPSFMTCPFLEKNLYNQQYLPSLGLNSLVSAR